MCEGLDVPRHVKKWLPVNQYKSPVEGKLLATQVGWFQCMWGALVRSMDMDMDMDMDILWDAYQGLRKRQVTL